MTCYFCTKRQRRNVVNPTDKVRWPLLMWSHPQSQGPAASDVCLTYKDKTRPKKYIEINMRAKVRTRVIDS